MPANAGDGQDKDRAYWIGELDRAKKRWRTFWDNGDTVVDAYRLQKADGNDATSKDKYNILYSSTETIRPNLYAQTPLPRVVLRSKDTASDTARAAAMLMEGCLKYLVDEEDFDELMDAVVEDYLLPGLGTAWVRYEATLQDVQDGNGKPVNGTDGKPQQELLDEMVKMEYVYWQDQLFGLSRNWKELPWAARRLWLTKEVATKRFGAAKANELKYVTREDTTRNADNPGETAEAWEIWNKTDKTVYWVAESCSTLLDKKADPLKLKKFFPTPRPLRAVSNTRTLVPRALYSQYKSQADTLNVMTKRIRLLSEALRVVGLYDGSQVKLADVLNPAAGNRMIAVDSWAQFAQTGGIKGNVEWVPIDAVVTTLNELLKAREVAKQEIYEVTGFSDIVRGVSKASETLGAQNLKADWAGARVKKMQKEVQRFARDLLALSGELTAEHCSMETIAVFSGVEIPDPQAVANDPELQQKVQLFKAACDMLKNELRRVSIIDIETDSTLLANEEAEREDRTKFLAAAGAFLQQSVPAMEATPELGPLLGAMLMFVVRTFPTSRPIEDEFEKVQQVMAQKGAQQDQDKDGKKAANALAQQELAAKTAHQQQELQQKNAADQAEVQQKTLEENNRHTEKMAELSLKSRELALKESQLKIEQNDERTRRFVAVHAAGIAEMGLEQEADQAVEDAEAQYSELDAETNENEAQRAHDASEADLDRTHEADENEADRAQQADLAQKAADAQKAAAEASAGPSEGSGGASGGNDA